jgi:FAD/FMN-containing dehydrogenase
MSRRDVLRRAGILGGATVVLAACGKGPEPTPVATKLPPTVRPSAPAIVDWTGLGAALDGKLLRGADTAKAARPYNSRFDGAVTPSAVVQAASPGDVATTVRFVADNGITFAVRSGGHAYPGWSTSSGLVLDVSGLRSVAVDTAQMQARIGAGCPLGTVYQALAAKGVGIPAGSCPTVGMGGLTQGGGIGLLTRAWGLTCDVVRSIEVVTADGVLRQVDANTDAELFWALRGGGGGSFGAVTAFTVAVRPVSTVSTFYYDWPVAVAGQMIDAWQHWVSSGAGPVSSTCKLLTTVATGEINPMIAGAAPLSEADLAAQLAPLLAQLPQPSSVSLHAHSYADAMLLEAGCSGETTEQCLAASMTPQARTPFAATSSIVDNLMPAAAIQAAVDRAHAATTVPGLGGAGISFDSLGGAVSDLALDANAFGHRGALATVQYTATWSNGGPAAPFDAFVRASRAAMGQWLGNGAYVNYADASIDDYASAYWGSHVGPLQQAKRAYDPSDLFTFPQSVRLPT